MKIKYCLPVIKNTKKEVLKAIKIKGYDFYEIWIDYIKDLDKKFILETARRNAGKIIFVLRRNNLEKMKLNIEERKDIISLISKFDVLLDLDFLTQHEELEFLRKGQTRIKLILSFHNYKETPKLDFLEAIVNKMKQYNPNIYKVSAYCQKEEDAFVLLNLLLRLKKQKLKYIILGMSQNGLITRIFGALWGNEINFAPKNLQEKSAPGQLTRNKLELILRELK